MKSIKPNVMKAGDDEGERHEHPAFGMIGITNRSGGGVLFGSDLGHSQCICITVKTADVDRRLSTDYFHGDRTVVELEMSHAQFARFITSPGQGDGVPCTIRYRESVGHVPGIDKIESKHETHRREVRESAKEGSSAALASLKGIQEMLDEGRMSKKEMRDALRSAICAIENLPGNLAYTVERAESALEKATSDAKIEVESYVAMTAQRLGLKQISDMGLLLEQRPQNSQVDFQGVQPSLKNEED